MHALKCTGTGSLTYGTYTERDYRGKLGHERRELKTGGGGVFGFEGGDGFNETSDGEGIADAALPADEMESATLASKGDGELHQRGNSRAIDLGNVTEIDDKLPRATLNEILGELGQMFTRFADGQAAVNLKVMDTARFASRNFQWWMKRHEIAPQFNIDGCQH